MSMIDPAQMLQVMYGMDLLANKESAFDHTKTPEQEVSDSESLILSEDSVSQGQCELNSFDIHISIRDCEAKDKPCHLGINQPQQ